MADKTLDLLELFGQSINDNLAQPNGGTKEQWGKYMGVFSQHTDSNDLPGVVFNDQLTVGGYPSTGSGSDITEYTLAVHHGGNFRSTSNAILRCSRRRIYITLKRMHLEEYPIYRTLTGYTLAPVGYMVPMNGFAYSK